MPARTLYAVFSKYTYDSAARLGIPVPVPVRTLCPVFSEYTSASAATLGTPIPVPARTLCSVVSNRADCTLGMLEGQPIITSNHKATSGQHNPLTALLSPQCLPSLLKGLGEWV